MAYTISQFRQIYYAQPQKIREVLVSQELDEAIETIANKYSLDEEGKSAISFVIELILIKIEKADNIIDLLKTALPSNTNVANIADDITNTILNKIDSIYMASLTRYAEEEKAEGREFDISEYLANLDNGGPTKEELLASIKKVANDSGPDSDDMMHDPVLKERVSEVCKKYNLSQDQSEALMNELLWVIAGMDSVANLPDNLQAATGLPDISIEQISDDLASRVFDYMIATYSGTPEENLPMEESGETAHNTTPEEKNWMGEVPKDTPITKLAVNSADENHKVETPAATVQTIPENLPGAMPVSKETQNEPVQQPTIGVPRYMATPEKPVNNIGVAQKPEQNDFRPRPDGKLSQALAAAKLASVVSSAPSEPKPQEKPAPDATLPSSYPPGQDPYREPLE